MQQLAIHRHFISSCVQGNTQEGQILSYSPLLSTEPGFIASVGLYRHIYQHKPRFVVIPYYCQTGLLWIGASVSGMFAVVYIYNPTSQSKTAHVFFVDSSTVNLLHPPPPPKKKSSPDSTPPGVGRNSRGSPFPVACNHIVNTVFGVGVDCERNDYSNPRLATSRKMRIVVTLHIA